MNKSLIPFDMFCGLFKNDPLDSIELRKLILNESEKYEYKDALLPEFKIFDKPIAITDLNAKNIRAIEVLRLAERTSNGINLNILDLGGSFGELAKVFAASGKCEFSYYCFDVHAKKDKFNELHENSKNVKFLYEISEIPKINYHLVVAGGFYQCVSDEIIKELAPIVQKSNIFYIDSMPYDQNMDYYSILFRKSQRNSVIRTYKDVENKVFGVPLKDSSHTIIRSSLILDKYHILNCLKLPNVDSQCVLLNSGINRKVVFYKNYLFFNSAFINENGLRLFHNC